MVDLAPGTTVRVRTPQPSVTPVHQTRGEKGDTGAPGGSDASFAAFVSDPASATRTQLSATIAAQAGPRLNTMALLGDSITNQNSGTLTGTSVVYEAKGFWTWANALLGQRFERVNASAGEGEFGGSGLAASALISGGHVAACAASSAHWVVVHAGTNDLATDSAATIAGNLLTIWRTLTATGKRVVATTVLPRDNVGDGTATFDKIRDVNRLIRANARIEPNVVLCDWYATMVDPATGKADLNNYYDGVHPDSVGAARMGKVLADVLATITPADGSVLPFDSADTKGLLPNPYMTGNVAGLATSTNGYVVGAGVYTMSKVARTDGIPGEWQQVQITSAPNPNADGAQIQQQNTAVGVDWNVGDTVYGVAEFETDAAAWAVRHFQVQVDAWNGLATAFALRNTTNDNNALTATLLRPTKGVLRTPPLVVPATTARLQLNAYVRGVGTIRWGRMEIFKL